MNRPTTFVEAEANFIADFPGWASRTTQQAFALAVEEALASNQHLLAQAACGTGKSFGVLVPVILDGRRAVVSTATKQLQNQYVEKDLPWLQAHLGVRFTYAMLKGRSNYFCLGGQTEVLTRNGPLPIASLVGASLDLVDGDGNWVQSEVKSFGQQRLYKMVLSRTGVSKTIYATAEHRWFLQADINKPLVETTTELLRIHPALGSQRGVRLAWGAPRAVEGTRKVERNERRWRVESVELTNLFEDVYCAVVPTTHSFVLEGNILTGNCTNRAGLVVAEDEMVPRLIELTKVPGFTGLREEVPFEVPNWLWTKVCGNTDECDEIGCKDMGGCYVLLAREVASMAQVVVVNHSLLALDGASGHGLLGEYDVVVVDEVHELAEYAIGAFETNFSELSVRSMQAEVRNFVNAIYGGDEKLDEVSESLSGANALFWMALTAQMPPRVDQLAITTEVITKAGDEWVTLANTLHEYAAAISALTTPIGTVEAKRFRILRKKARIMAAKFSDLINNPFDTWVRWIEWQTNYVRNTRRLAIKAQPVEVGPFLQEFLFANCTVIGVSATVAPGGKFEFMAGQLGLAADQYRGVDVGTNFDYQHQALTYVPTIAAPSNEPGNDWERALPIQIKALLDASQGRALVLFTSIKQLNNVYDAISDVVPWTCYKQGQFNQGELMRRFSTETNSVLFATKSWFTGVDIQGESLSMVILDRIPFKNPKDPVVAATSALYDRRYPPSGSFAHYTLPSATMTLSQAYGRLIRTVTDRGVFACLDSRLLKTWGAGIARQLPPAPRTSNIDDVTGFFA
jgi:ATP-dependent DNA helicase DinG